MRTELQIRTEIRQLKDELRQLRRKGRSISAVRRKLGVQPARRKGQGVRIGDRDVDATKRMRDPRSYVRRDGSEVRYGDDWVERRFELQNRSRGLCEMFMVMGQDHVPGCDRRATEPHHIIKRSVRRNDEMCNLADLSHACHASLDPRRVRNGRLGR